MAIDYGAFNRAIKEKRESGRRDMKIFTVDVSASANAQSPAQGVGNLMALPGPCKALMLVPEIYDEQGNDVASDVSARIGVRFNGAGEWHLFSMMPFQAAQLISQKTPPLIGICSYSGDIYQAEYFVETLSGVGGAVFVFAALVDATFSYFPEPSGVVGSQVQSTPGWTGHGPTGSPGKVGGTTI